MCISIWELLYKSRLAPNIFYGGDLFDYTLDLANFDADVLQNSDVFMARATCPVARSTTPPPLWHDFGNILGTGSCASAYLLGHTGAGFHSYGGGMFFRRRWSEARVPFL